MATLPKALPKAAGPSKMKKAGAGGRSPATSNAHNSRRQSMLILDLQSRKKGVLRQILTTRRELADLDEAEMRETATVLSGAGSGVPALDIEGSEEEDEMPTADGLNPSGDQFSPMAGDVGEALGEAPPAKPGSSAEVMYVNQRKFNKGLEQLKVSQTNQLDEIQSLKARLQSETDKAGQQAGGGTNAFMHMLESPMQTAIYTVQETITELENKESGSQEDKDVAMQLTNVLQTLTAANPYLPAFDFSRPEYNMTTDTQDWLVNTFHHPSQTRVGNKAETTTDEEGVPDDAAAAEPAAATPVGPGSDLTMLSSATFDCFSLPDDQYVTGIETMFKATGVLEKFKVSPTVFRNFLTAVQSGYRNNPYHNFRHAFDVTQMTYVIVTSTKMGKTLAPLELFSLMLTAVCHDVDHGGKTNDFLINTSSPLALLYNGRSVNENHHSCLTFKLMRDDRINVLGNLTGEEKREARKMMISLFLATDMANHFDIINKFTTRVEADQFSRDDADDRQLLLNVLLHASDLSNPTRPFETSKKWAVGLSAEWFQQGDMEKRMGVDVSPMCARPAPEMEPEKALAPGQIGFATHVVMPMFVQLVRGLDGGDESGVIKGCVTRLEQNRESWTALKDS